jgi:hypothetical protein
VRTRRPNFFVVGAAKSGTTAFCAALARHPEVFFTDPKEPHFYYNLYDAKAIGRGILGRHRARRAYLQQFAGATTERAIGEGSVTNLWSPVVADHIARDFPSARIVAILRQPIDRAFAQFRHVTFWGGEHLSFEEAIRTADARLQSGTPRNYDYLSWGRYAQQLGCYYERFGRDHVLVHLYDDWSADAQAVLRTTYRFLGIDPDLHVEVGRENELTSEQYGGSPRPQLDPALRAQLTTEFESEFQQLEALIGRDLSAWRKPAVR